MIEKAEKELKATVAAARVGVLRIPDAAMAQLRAADELADAVEAVARKLKQEHYGAPIQASDALRSVLTAYREVSK